MSSDELREALKTAKVHLITLGGDPRRNPYGDHVQSAVLDEIDTALAQPQNDAEAAEAEEMMDKQREAIAEVIIEHIHKNAFRQNKRGWIEISQVSLVLSLTEAIVRMLPTILAKPETEMKGK